MKNYLAALIISLMIGACVQHNAPIINKSPSRNIPEAYKVKAGDSIYNIAWAFGVDFLDIAKWSNLKEPYKLNGGQVLRLREPTVSISALEAGSDEVSELIVSKELPAKQKTKPITTDDASATDVTFSKSPSQWNWPVEGKLIGKFSPAKGSNGIQISGADGSHVKSTAAGQVIYVGEGLRGYGKLVILKHSEQFLSAYAHNRNIIVKEGQAVKSGEQIALMGNSGTDLIMLHFEIRKDGKPVDPLNYLK